MRKIIKKKANFDIMDLDSIPVSFPLLKLMRKMNVVEFFELVMSFQANALGFASYIYDLVV